MDWDLPQLRAFATVVDEGSLEAAAAALQLTPSAVSQRIKALERSVGAVLLRRGRPATATTAGQPVLRLARQLAVISAAADAELSAAEAGLPQVRLAVNSDSLATWTLPALADLAAQMQIIYLREDQDHTTELLRDGRAMAAITSQQHPVQGCTVETLGLMRYRPVASPAFVDRWFNAGVTAEALSCAPVMIFDERDRLQLDRLAEAGLDPANVPAHAVPASTQFGDAVGLGYGWGMLPEIQPHGWEGVDLSSIPGSPLGVVDVTLYWQQWSLHTPSLDAVAQAIRTAARRDLRPAHQRTSRLSATKPVPQP